VTPSRNRHHPASLRVVPEVEAILLVLLVEPPGLDHRNADRARVEDDDACDGETRHGVDVPRRPHLPAVHPHHQGDGVGEHCGNRHVERTTVAVAQDHDAEHRQTGEEHGDEHRRSEEQVVHGNFFLRCRPHLDLVERGDLYLIIAYYIRDVNITVSFTSVFNTLIL